MCANPPAGVIRRRVPPGPCRVGSLAAHPYNTDADRREFRTLGIRRFFKRTEANHASWPRRSPAKQREHEVVQRSAHGAIRWHYNCSFVASSRLLPALHCFTSVRTVLRRHAALPSHTQKRRPTAASRTVASMSAARLVLVGQGLRGCFVFGSGVAFRSCVCVA